MINNYPNKENVFKCPYPHIHVENFLKNDVAKQIQQDVLNIDDKYFDSFSNPFEKNKNFSHKQKEHLPKSVKKLFSFLNSSEWLNQLSNIFDIENIEGDKKLYLWGIHTYKENGKLEPHLDAKLCPLTNREKVITMCLYLSHNWKKEYGGEAEVWNSNNYKITNINKKIPSLFNTLVLFQSNESSYHGVGKIINNLPQESTRILITASFYRKINKNELRLIKDQNRPHGLFKALFATITNNTETEKLIKLRANKETCNEIINMKDQN